MAVSLFFMTTITPLANADFVEDALCWSVFGYVTCEVAEEVVENPDTLLDIFGALLKSNVVYYSSCLIFTELAELTNANEYIGEIIPDDKLTADGIDVLVSYFETNNKHFCENPEDLVRLGDELNEVWSEAESKPYDLLPLMSEVGRDDNLLDAIRHSRLTASLSYIFNKYAAVKRDWGLQLMNTHEDGKENNYYQMNMDLHNNLSGYSTYQYFVDNNLAISADRLDTALLSRCFKFIETGGDGVTDSEKLAYDKLLSELNGLAYVKKEEVAYEDGGVNCPVAKVEQLFIFIDKDEPLNLSASSSHNANNSSWKVTPGIKNCVAATGECVDVTNVVSSNLMMNSNISGDSFKLGDSNPRFVNVSVYNEYGDSSLNNVEIQINNWAPMVAVVGLLLN